MQGLSLCLSQFEMLYQKVNSTFDAIAFGLELCEHDGHDCSLHAFALAFTDHFFVVCFSSPSSDEIIRRDKVPESVVGRA